VAKMRDAEPVRSEVLVLHTPDRAEDTPPSVMVVPVTEDGDVVMVKQYRHNLKRDTLELPSGLVTAGEGAALLEVAEMTGYALAPGGELHDLGTYYALPAETNKHVHFYLALGVRPGGTAQEDTETSAVALPFEQAFSLIGTAIHGLETVAALLLARHTLGTPA